MNEMFFNYQCECVKVPQSPIYKLMSPFKIVNKLETPEGSISLLNICWIFS